MQSTRFSRTVRPIWSGHLLIFGKAPRDPYPNDAGIRILAACILLEGVVRPFLLAALRWLGIANNFWSGPAIVAAMMVLVLALTRLWIRVPFARLGLYRCNQWTSAEKWFCLQSIAAGLVTFTVVRWPDLRLLPQRPAWLQTTAIVFAWHMTWGFYQEYVYRGMLQTELVRRWGAVTGILLSNLLFTFGPLHAYHFRSATDNPAHLWIFAAIFAIGLYFGVLFQRSGNLWMIGVLHGLGDFFIDGLAKIR